MFGYYCHICTVYTDVCVWLADRLYQQNVTTLGKVHDDWLKEHIKACEVRLWKITKVKIGLTVCILCKWAKSFCHVSPHRCLRNRRWSALTSWETQSGLTSTSFPSSVWAVMRYSNFTAAVINIFILTMDQMTVCYMKSVCNESTENQYNNSQLCGAFWLSVPLFLVFCPTVVLILVRFQKSHHSRFCVHW